MRTRTIAIAVGGFALSGVAVAGPAQAANCKSISCLQREVKSLTSQVKKLTTEVKSDHKYVSSLQGCLSEAPITRYGDGTSGTYGYVYNPGNNQPTFDTTALDGTASGQQVSVWAMFDHCNTQTTAPARDASTRRAMAEPSPFGPIAPSFLLTEAFPR